MGKNKRKCVNAVEKSSSTYFKEIGAYKSLSLSEEIELWKKYKKTNNIEYRNKLVEANLKFVATIAKKYNGLGLSYSDLIAEGNIGLMKAIEKYDGSKGYKAISYSVWWIKQTIMEALYKRKGVEHESIDDYMPFLDEKKSINDSDESVNNEDIKNTIDLLMSNLNKKEKYIVSHYYGLNGVNPMTLEEIGDSMGLTKERIRQLNEKALIKMRSNALLNDIECCYID